MQRQVPTIKREQRTVSSTQVLDIDEHVNVFVATRDRLTDEESPHEHLADSLRETSCFARGHDELSSSRAPGDRAKNLGGVRSRCEEKLEGVSE